MRKYFHHLCSQLSVRVLRQMLRRTSRENKFIETNNKMKFYDHDAIFVLWCIPEFFLLKKYISRMIAERVCLRRKKKLDEICVTKYRSKRKTQVVSRTIKIAYVLSSNSINWVPSFKFMFIMRFFILVEKEISPIFNWRSSSVSRDNYILKQFH